MDGSASLRVEDDQGTRPNSPASVEGGQASHAPPMKPRKSNFLKKAKIVISVKNSEIYSLDLKWQNRFHCWNRLAKSSYHVEFRQIPRQSKFTRFSRH